MTYFRASLEAQFLGIYLNVFVAEGDFAVLAVESPGFTLSLIVAVLLGKQDQHLTCFALYTLKFTSPFVLYLGKHAQD